MKDLKSKQLDKAIFGLQITEDISRLQVLCVTCILNCFIVTGKLIFMFSTDNKK